MNEKKKKIEEINKIYQNPISSEEENQKQKLTELYKSIHEPLTSVEKQKQQEIELLKKSFSSVKSSIGDILVSEIPNSNRYIKRYFDMAEDIDDKDLLSFTENINKDKFKYDMEQLNKTEPIHEIKHPSFPDFPNYGKRITDSLVLVVNQLEEHKSLLKEQIEKKEVSQVNNTTNINFGDVKDSNINNIVGDKNHLNTQFDNKFNELIQAINNSNIKDKELILQELKNNKNNEVSLKKSLGVVLTKGAEFGSIVSAVSALLGL
ncbi:MAG: hypothetical protein WCY75_08515 [Sulfurimonadaceae bacterium]